MSDFEETLYDSVAQKFRIDKLYFEDKTEHQHLMIFHNAALGRVMTLDGVVQTTEADEFVYHEMMAHVPLLAHERAEQVLIIGGGDGGGAPAPSGGASAMTGASAGVPLTPTRWVWSL